MLTDQRTWTTLLYMVLALPIGIFSFVFAVVGVVVPLALLFAPLGVLFGLNDHITIDDVSRLRRTWAPAVWYCAPSSDSFC